MQNYILIFQITYSVLILLALFTNMAASKTSSASCKFFNFRTLCIAVEGPGNPESASDQLLKEKEKNLASCIYNKTEDPSLLQGSVKFISKHGTGDFAVSRRSA